MKDTEDNIFELIDFGDLLPMAPDVKFLIDPILPAAYVTILAARGGVGKSAYALYISDKLVGQGKKVLYLDGESCVSLFKKRCLEWNFKNWKKIKTLRLIKRPFETHCPQKIDLIGDVVKSYLPDLLVIDSLTSLARNYNLNDKKDVSKIFLDLMDIASFSGAAILVLAHTKKKQNADELITLDSIAGSGTITDFSKSVILMENENNSTTRTVTQVKNNIKACAEPFTFELTEHGITEGKIIFTTGEPICSREPEIRKTETKIGRIKQAAIELLKTDTEFKEIRRILKKEHHAFDAEIKGALDWACERLNITHIKI